MGPRRKRKCQTKQNMTRECKCKIHVQVTNGAIPDRIYTVESRGRGWNAKAHKKLIELGAMTKRSSYVCNLCLAHGSRRYQLDNDLHQVSSGDQSQSDTANTDTYDETPTETDEPVINPQPSIEIDPVAEVVNLVDQLIDKLTFGGEVNCVVKEKLKGRGGGPRSKFIIFLF